jgi:phospholipid transport system substrate-binding protein
MKLRHIAVIVLLLCPGTIWGAVPSSPTEQVRTTIDGILQILQDGTLSRETRWERIGALIQSRFDFESMSQRVLSTNWKKATREERRQFVEFFSQYLEDTYRSKIEAYTDEQVRYVGEKIKGERAVVDTTIVTDTAEIPVSYKLKQTDGEWLGIDVVIENVSLVSNYRNTFAAIVKTEGMEGLLNDLQRRIARQKSLQTN